MHRRVAFASLFLIACGPTFEDRDTTPATPTVLEGEIPIDSLEGASRLGLHRHRYAWAIAPGDLDGDDLDDLVVLERLTSDPGRGFVHVFLGSRKPLPRDLRTYDADVSFELGEGFGRYDRTRAIGDLDGDGRSEFALEHDPYSAEQDLAILRWEDLHEGVLDFEDAGTRLRTTDAGSHVFVYSSRDLDGDGIDDLWLDLRGLENIEIGSVFVPGSPDFFSREQTLADRPVVPPPALVEHQTVRSRDFADLDGDGRLEAIEEISGLEARDDRLDVYPLDALREGERGDPVLSFPMSSNWGLLNPGSEGEEFHAFDFNGDGRDDLPLAPNDRGLAILLGGQQLGALEFRDYPLTPYEFSHAGDIDGDGYDDLLIVEYNVEGVGRAHLFYGDGDPSGTLVGPNATFHTRETLGLGLNIIAAGDLNGDGFDDFIFSQGTFTGWADNEPNAYLHVIYGAPR